MQAPQMSLSCLSCSRRKVRCDRSKPCSHCRRRKGDICEYPVPIGTLWNNNRKPPLDGVQSERIRRLEQYIRSLGSDPDQIVQTAISGPMTSEELLIPNEIPAIDNLMSRQNIKRQRDGSFCTATSGLRSSEQARLVEHDEQTTYIEAFGPLPLVFVKEADNKFVAVHCGINGVRPNGQLPTRPGTL